MSSSSEEAESRRVAVLVSDYEQLREDERNLVTIQAGILSVAVTILAAIPFALQQTCAFQGRPFDQVPSKDEAPCTVVSNLWVLAAFPVVPLAVIAFLMSLGIVSVVRSYYIRAVESELQQYARVGHLPHSRFVPLSYVGTLNEITSFTRGLLGFRAIIGLIVLSILMAFGGLTVYIATSLPQPYRWVTLVVFGTGAMLLLAEQGRIVFAGRSIFTGAYERYLLHRGSLPLSEIREPWRPRDVERSLFSYLLLPRLDDAAKTLITPAVLLLILLFSPTARPDLPRFLALWLTFEVLVYQARYQWNDIRGLRDDMAHPERRQKKRLPAGSTVRNQVSAVKASWAVIAMRLTLALLLGWWLGVWLPILALVLVVVVNAVMYEYLKSHPGDVTLGGGPSARTRFLWLAVCPGYGIRAAVPLMALQPSPSGPGAYLLVFAIMAFGFMVVSMLWALEGTAYCRLRPEWSATADLLRLPHLLRLLEFTRWKPVRVGPGSISGADERVLESRSDLAAPWHLAGVLTVVLGTASLLTMQGVPPLLIALAALSVLVFWIALCAAERAVTHAAMIGGAAAVTVTFAALDDHPALVYAWGAPLVAVAAAFASLRHSSFRSFRNGLPDLLHRVRGGAAWFLRLATGTSTWDYLNRVERPNRPLDSED